LQGWLEGLEWRGLRRWRPLRRRFPRGVLPVLFSAIPFALMHLRAPGPQPSGEQLQFLLAGNALVWLIALAFALFWMRIVRGATAADFGWAPESFFHDLRLGLFIFIALIVPMYCLQAAAHFILPQDVTPDPLPLFLLAAVLGGIYYSNHRVVPLIVAHLAINAFAFCMALADLF
jgi:hypothetical protein